MKKEERKKQEIRMNERGNDEVIKRKEVKRKNGEEGKGRMKERKIKDVCGGGGE